MSKAPLGLLQRLKTQLQKNELDKIRPVAEQAPPFDSAWCVSRFPVEEQVRFFSALTPELSAKIFQEMDLNKQTEILKLGRLPVLSELLRHLDSDKMADVLGSLDPIEKEKWMDTLPMQEKQEAQSLLAYAPDTAGGLMAKEYVTVPLHLKAGEVASRLQALASNYEHLRVTYVYVVDDAGALKGVLPLRDLIFRPREMPIENFMVRDVVTITDTATKREVAELFRERNLLALPVITASGHMVGVITSDDVMDVIQELASDEMLKISGVSQDETRDAPVKTLVRRRLSWLTINIVLDLLAASVITFYQDTLSAVITLAFFLPIISDMSGCSGMQAVALSIRDLALQKILPTEHWRVLRKELLIGFINGLVLGMILGTVAYFMKGLPMLGVVVALSLWLNSIIAVAFGGVVPLLLKYFKFDPAVASGPILTTVTDMVGFFILLSLATFWLPWLKN